MERKLHKETLEKVDTLRKKFEQLRLLISKDKTMNNIQDITCHKCKKPSHYMNQPQLTESTIQVSGYCGRYRHIQGSTVGVFQADIRVMFEFGCRVVYID